MNATPVPVMGLSEPWPDPHLLCRADNPDTIRSRPAAQYADDGYLIVPRLLDDATIDRYCHEFTAEFPPALGGGGWQYPTPYMDRPFIADLVCDGRIAEFAADLIGEPMAVHLNLSGWRSTTRNWHQDGYLNPDSNLDWYVAVWIALDDIDPAAGPFEFIPGSHRLFDVIRHDRMIAALHPDERGPLWPTHSERLLTPFFETEIAERELPVHQFLAHKGDVLFWHSRLLHRGSIPTNPDLERRAMIAHYSGIHHRPDMPTPRRRRNGWLFPIGT